MYQPLAKHIIFRLHEKVMGRKTYACLKELEKSQWLSSQDLEDLKFKKLRELLIHANDHIAFYASRFADCGFDPREMKTIGDINVIPLLSKAEIRKNLESMRAWLPALV